MIVANIIWSVADVVQTRYSKLGTETKVEPFSLRLWSQRKTDPKGKMIQRTTIDTFKNKLGSFWENQEFRHSITKGNLLYCDLSMITLLT